MREKRVSDYGERTLIQMASNCGELSNRVLVDLYLELHHRFLKMDLLDDRFDTFIAKLEQIDGELMGRLEK